MILAHQQFTEDIHQEAVSLREVLHWVLCTPLRFLAVKLLENRIDESLARCERMLVKLNKFEAENCESCDTDCGMVLKSDLAGLVDGYSQVLEKAKQVGINEILIGRTEELLVQLDDKLDTYTFSSDKEMRDLVRAMSDRLNSNAEFRS